MLKRFLKKALKKDKMVIKKTDNEIVRYIKQTNMIEERKRFEELMKQEEERKAKGLNDREKRALYFRDMATLEKRVYNKAYINDNNVDFKSLTDKENYKVLPSQKYRPFYLKPFYAKPTDFSDQISARVWCLRIFGSLILLKLGYEFGAWDGKALNEKLK